MWPDLPHCYAERHGASVEGGRLAVLGRRWARRTGWATMILSWALLVALSCAYFVWPASDRPRRVDAILSLDGADEALRVARAVGLVEQGYSDVLLFSQGAYRSEACPRLPKVDVVCFVPAPARTVGEVEFAARYAAVRGWHSLMVVSGHTQATRARLLLARCFKGKAVVVPAAPPSIPDLVYQVLYEWGALVKALVVDPGC